MAVLFVSIPLELALFARAQPVQADEKRTPLEKIISWLSALLMLLPRPGYNSFIQPFNLPSLSSQGLRTHLLATPICAEKTAA